MRVRKKPLSSNLPEREVAICLRLREARERLGLNQETFAKRAGFTRGALGNYELCRTPLRADLALRICRTFIVSEEWLATGEFAAVHAVAPQFKLDTPEGKTYLGEVFFRQSMDLASESIILEVPHAALFSVAYDQFLAPVYANLVRANFPDPRIKRSLLGDPKVSINLLDLYVRRWLRFLGRVAPFSDIEPEEVQNEFLGNLLVAGQTIFAAMMGFERADFETPAFDFLRAIASGGKSKIGPLKSAPPE